MTRYIREIARTLSAVLPLMGWQSAAYARWQGWAGNEENE